jgi:hypothetical protein
MEVMELSRMAGVLVDLLRNAGYGEKQILNVSQLMAAHLAADEEHTELSLHQPDPPLN